MSSRFFKCSMQYMFHVLRTSHLSNLSQFERPQVTYADDGPETCEQDKAKTVMYENIRSTNTV